MTRKASTSCNHVCIHAMEDRQKSIGDDWAVVWITTSVEMLRRGWQKQYYIVQIPPQILTKMAMEPNKS